MHVINSQGIGADTNGVANLLTEGVGRWCETIDTEDDTRPDRAERCREVRCIISIRIHKGPTINDNESRTICKCDYRNLHALGHVCHVMVLATGCRVKWSKAESATKPFGRNGVGIL